MAGEMDESILKKEPKIEANSDIKPAKIGSKTDSYSNDTELEAKLCFQVKKEPLSYNEHLETTENLKNMIFPLAQSQKVAEMLDKNSNENNLTNVEFEIAEFSHCESHIEFDNEGTESYSESKDPLDFEHLDTIEYKVDIPDLVLPSISSQEFKEYSNENFLKGTIP